MHLSVTLVNLGLKAALSRFALLLVTVMGILVNLSAGCFQEETCDIACPSGEALAIYVVAGDDRNNPGGEMRPATAGAGEQPGKPGCMSP